MNTTIDDHLFGGAFSDGGLITGNPTSVRDFQSSWCRDRGVQNVISGVQYNLGYQTNIAPIGFGNLPANFTREHFELQYFDNGQFFETSVAIQNPTVVIINSPFNVEEFSQTFDSDPTIPVRIVGQDVIDFRTGATIRTFYKDIFSPGIYAITGRAIAGIFNCVVHVYLLPANDPNALDDGFVGATGFVNSNIFVFGNVDGTQGPFTIMVEFLNMQVDFSAIHWTSAMPEASGTGLPPDSISWVSNNVIINAGVPISPLYLSINVTRIG